VDRGDLDAGTALFARTESASATLPDRRAAGHPGGPVVRRADPSSRTATRGPRRPGEYAAHRRSSCGPTREDRLARVRDRAIDEGGLVILREEPPRRARRVVGGSNQSRAPDSGSRRFALAHHPHPRTPPRRLLRLNLPPASQRTLLCPSTIGSDHEQSALAGISRHHYRVHHPLLFR
jgi:hypothetical protein